MAIIVLGINHKTAPLAVREKIAFAGKDEAEAYRLLIGKTAVKQCVIVSTCNRAEIYALASCGSSGLNALLKMLKTLKNVEKEELENCLYFYSGFEAIVHLFKVASGLDSMVLGETQISGQIKKAYKKATSHHAVGKELHGLFQHAAKCAKKVQTETKINHHAVSVSYIAVEMLKKELGSFADLKVLVIGAGKMSRLTLNHLSESGATDVMVTSKTYHRAKYLAGQFHGRTIDFQRKEDTLPVADIIISSTSAPHLLLYKEEMAKVMEKRHDRPVFIIDLAVPRDIDPKVSTLKNVYLFDMDSLEVAAEENRRQKQNDALAAQALVRSEAEKFESWLKTLAIEPVITALRKRGHQIRQLKTDRCFERQLNRLDEKEKQAVERLTRSIVDALLKKPIVRMKEQAQACPENEYASSLLYLFDLEEECFLSE